MSQRTPAELVIARSEAFNRGDFGFIYDSCHPESNFCRQFPERQEYLRFGASSLVHDYRISRCRVLAERIEEDEAQVIFLMALEYQGSLQEYAELAWLKRAERGWLYHRGLKMSADELPPDPESLVFADFDRLDQATIF